MDEENSLMEDSCDVEYVCGDPKVDIRVGDEYQAEIPPMLSESKRAMLLSNPLALDLNSDPLCSFGVGQPVEIMWIDTNYSREGDDDNVDMNESLKSLKTKRSRRGETDGNSQGSKKDRMNLLEALPEKASSSWEDFEVDGFVLGLYTFGKNFTQMKKLLGSKETGDILSFYYGKFYKSAKHKVWSNSLKKRSRRCIQGKKLYSGWRLQLLLSRVIPRIPERKQMLIDVSKSFAEGNKSLEEYISAVKELVGLRFLVEAVAIGKEKEDLTVLTTEPVKSKQWFTVSSSSSVAVAAGLGPYSSLTSEEIIKKLSGGSRLSKARCNDIFWEAVWPRLLARGWHSEQPKDRGYIKSKDQLVFLIPGVPKFSRRKLVKKNHYFDSISDILNKVVSDPELIEFETAEIRAPIEKNLCGQSNQEKHRYLKSPGSASTHMKFTVVDTTSLATGGKLCEFRELKYPNPEPLVSLSKAFRGDKDSSMENFQTKRAKLADEGKWERRRMKKLVDEPMRFMIVDTSMDHGGLRRRRHLPADDKIRKFISREAFGDSTTQNQSATKGTDSGVKETLEKNNVQQGYRSKKRFARNSESNNHHSVSSLHLPKRRRLSACVRKDIRRSGESSVFKPPALDHSYPKLSVDLMNFKIDQSEETGNGIQERPEIEPNGFCPISETVHELRSSAPQQQQQQEDESNRFGSMSVLDKKCSSKDLETVQRQEEPIRLPTVSGADKNPPSNDHETAAHEQQEEQNQETNNTDAPRRQSTRKRPLTTRALEAIESGFYTAKSMKTTSKPRKRERSARIKNSASASKRTQGESDNGFRVEEATASKPIEDTEPSFLVNKATTTSKPVDQIEDSKKAATEFPKLPPIVLKLPFKRG